MTTEALPVDDTAQCCLVGADVHDVQQGYRQTGIGAIPGDWNVCLLGSVASFRTGPFGSALHKSDYVAGGVPLVNPMHIVEGELVPDPETSVSTEVAQRLAAYRLKRGDIVMARRGDMGRCALISASYAGWLCGTGSLIIRCSEAVDPRFIQRVLTTPRVIAAIEEASVGSTMVNLNQAALSRLEIQRPPLAEQGAIAEALSDVDRLIAALEAWIAKKRAIKQGAMQELLCGKIRLAGFRQEWTELNMARDSVLKARIGWQGLTTAEYLTTGDYYLVTGTDFIGGRVNWQTCHFVERDRFIQDRNIQLAKGDVLLTKDGTIGKAGYVNSLPGPATLNSGVFVIRPKGDAYLPLYMFYVLTSSIFGNFLARLQAGSTISHLYQKDFVDFTFRAPALDEQTAIAAVLSDMDAELSALEARRDKTRAIKQGMMQQLVTGRVRLTQPSPAEAGT